MQNLQMLIGAALFVVLIIGGAWYLSRPHTALAPATNTTATTTPATSSPTATSTAPAHPQSSTPASQYTVITLPVSSQDTIASWSFKGAYTGNTTLEQKANADIARLTGLLSNTQDVTIQETYISIGNQYQLLGDGKNAYDSYLKALNTTQRYEQEDAIAWGNLGDLMATLKAYHTAETAYTKATAALPGEPSLYVARISFLLQYMPNNAADIQAAFTAADKNVPGDASIAQLRAQYQKSKTQ